MDYLVDTWICPNCKYKQDYEPTHELTLIHNADTPAGLCPACYTGRNQDRKKEQVELVVAVSPIEKIVISVVTDEELAAREVLVTDDAGEPVKGEEGSVYRQLTEEELAELKVVRDKDIQYLDEAPNTTFVDEILKEEIVRLQETKV